MADPKPYRDGLAELAGILAEARSRLRELEAATGTQTAGLLDRVNQALADIATTVQTEIAAQSYTREVIDQKDSTLRTDLQAGIDGKAPAVHQHGAGDITSGTIARPVSTTSVTSSGDMRGATLYGATLYASGAPGYNITGTRVAAWWQSADGRAGTASSSERYKTKIRPADVDPEAILDMVPVYYQYLAALEHAEWRRSCGPPYAEWDPTAKAPLELGMIAERLHEAGLWQFVVYERDPWGRLLRNAAGDPIPDGIHYINWGVALQVVARWERDQRLALTRRVDDFEQRLAALEIT